MSRQATLLGVLGAVLVAVLWWFFVYSPGQEELAQVETEVEAAQDEQVALQQRVARLEATRARAAETEAAIATLRSFVPDDPGLPGALRQIQAAADDAGVDLSIVSTARPVALDEGAGLYAATVALSAEGSYFQLVDFLRRLEEPRITSRGITFNSLTLSTEEYPTLTALINGQMYSVLDPVPSVDGGTPAEPAETDAEPAEGEAEAEDEADDTAGGDA